MATAALLPVSDVTSNWEDSTAAGPNHWQEIDEDATDGGTSPEADDYVETDTVDAVDEWNFAASPAGLSEGTSMVVDFYAIITDASGTASIDADLRHTASSVSLGVEVITIAQAGGSGAGAVVQKTWSGLTLTKAQADSLSMRVTHRATGS